MRPLSFSSYRDRAHTKRRAPAAPKSKSIIDAELTDWVSKSTTQESDGGKASSDEMKRRRDSDLGKPARRRVQNVTPTFQSKNSSRRLADKSPRRNPISSSLIMKNNGSSRESSDWRDALDLKKNSIQNNAKERRILTDLISEESDVDDDDGDDFLNKSVNSLFADGVAQDMLTTSSSYLSETRYLKVVCANFVPDSIIVHFFFKSSLVT